MLYCVGQNCPLNQDCYHHTQPSPGRDRFAALPYNPTTKSCEFFYSNKPSDDSIRDAAYYLWLSRGCPPNSEQQMWDEAYRNLCISSGRMRAD